MSDLNEPPNMYDIYSLSGVYSILSSMPNDSYKVSEEFMKSVKYQLWARSAIDYDESGCEVPIDTALDTLNEMESENEGGTDIRKNFLSALITISCIYIAACVITFGCLNLCNAKERRLTCTVCIFWTSCCMTLCQLIIVILGFVIKGHVAPGHLSEWYKSDGCLQADPYMVASVDEIETNGSLAAAGKASVTIMAICIVL